jgi:hypothetical protein
MKFECGDLERALAVPELMAEAREHLKTCASCRNEYRLWSDISSAARELHEEWDSPALWPNIRQALEAERERTRQRNQSTFFGDWKTWALAATVVLGAVLLLRPWQGPVTQPKGGVHLRAAATASDAASDKDFLTEQALVEVEQAEDAYRRSIDKLAAVAGHRPETTQSALAINDRAKLIDLDSAIADTRAGIEQNPYNAGLRNELAALYREKQETLKGELSRDQKN